jgi:hypothetical protein
MLLYSTCKVEKSGLVHWTRSSAGLCWATLAAIGLVAGCGGGSGQAPSPTSPEPPATGRTPGTVTLNWTPPTSNEDGSPLTDLAGFRVYYGQTPGAWEKQLDVPAAVASLELQGLATGSWYFVVTSYNATGAESVPTGIVGAAI